MAPIFFDHDTNDVNDIVPTELVLPTDDTTTSFLESHDRFCSDEYRGFNDVAESLVRSSSMLSPTSLFRRQQGDNGMTDERRDVLSDDDQEFIECEDLPHISYFNREVSQSPSPMGAVSTINSCF